MPNTKSAQKAMRVSRRRRAINLLTIEKYKDAIKAVRQAVAAKKKDEAQKDLPLAYQQLDKAVKKGAIKKNKSARLKSRLAKSLAKL